MAKSRPWLLRFWLLTGLLVAVGLVCLCVAVFVGSGCSRGSFARAAVSADSQLCSEIGR